jgi:hypothetical protein
MTLYSKRDAADVIKSEVLKWDDNLGELIVIRRVSIRASQKRLELEEKAA